jgi:arylsulfatase A-like enzyme
MRILYIDIDSLRPDHLGCYGYHRNTSPNIDALAKEAVRFTRCYCSDAPCLPSRTALYTGMFGIHSGIVGHGGTAADLRIDGPDRGFVDRVEAQSLPSELQRAGIYTALVSPFGQRHAARNFHAGFREILNTGKCGLESAEEVTPTVMKWLRDHAGEDNWYLHLNYWDPHTPYRVPASYGNPFANEPLPEWLTDEVLAEHQQKVGPHCAQEVNMWNDVEDPRFPRQPGAVRDRADLHRMIDGYDTGIRYVDEHLGQIFAFLKESGLWENTAIIVTADHGENQGELGIYGEHATADSATCRVPLIIRWPGARAGGIDEGFHYNLDFAPTLADLLGRQPQPIWDGRSFASALRGNAPCGRNYLVLGQCAHVCQRSVVFGPWLYIRTYHDGFHLFPREMLFELEKDPHEQDDLAEQHPEICSHALRLLTEWHDEMMAAMNCDRDPLWTVMSEGGPFHARGELAKYCGRLRKTGRAWAVEELQMRHPREKR